MSRRIDIELTSSQSDGSWTWRAAGAREPKGTVPDPSSRPEPAVGATLRVEVEQGLDGIEVLGVVGGRQRSDDGFGRLEIIGSESASSRSSRPAPSVLAARVGAMTVGPVARERDNAIVAGSPRR